MIQLDEILQPKGLIIMCLGRLESLIRNMNYTEKLLFHIDTNCTNERQNDNELNELERLAEFGVIEIQYSEITYSEAEVGKTPERRIKKIDNYTWAGLSGESSLEKEWRERITEAVFPQGLGKKSASNDVEALLTAKLAGAIFVTKEGESKSQPRGILGSKSELLLLGIEVVSPLAALVLAKSQMNYLDKLTFFLYKWLLTIFQYSASALKRYLLKIRPLYF